MSARKPKHDNDEVRKEVNRAAPAPMDSRAPAREAVGGGAEPDAPPTNRASHNCNGEEGIFLLPLRWGVDSLYLSYKGSLDPGIDNELQKLKALAQSQNPLDVGIAQYRVEDHLFQVKDKGAGLFPYILDNYAYRLQLSKWSSKALPLAYAKIASGYLAAKAVEDIEAELWALLGKLGELKGFPTVGRIDLFVDFVTDVNLEGWDRSAWVTRASAINSYSVDGAFSGWAIGIGGAMAARLYDKTLEIQKSHKDYLKEVWRGVGWDGERRVWQLEFQFKRDVLGQLGLTEFSSVMASLGGLWSYAMTEWLKLTLPNAADKTRSRWPVHPLWAALASVDWETQGGPLLRSYPENEAPDDSWIFQAGLRPIISFMATRGIADLGVGLPAFCKELVAFHEEEAYRLGRRFPTYVLEKVRLKVREYGTGFNLDEDCKRTEVDSYADEYRRRSDGQ